jgi:hypothetical protein
MQPSVCCQTEDVQAILLAFPHQIYKQIGHNDWQTAMFTKPVTLDDVKELHKEIQDVLKNE